MQEKWLVTVGKAGANARYRDSLYEENMKLKTLLIKFWDHTTEAGLWNDYLMNEIKEEVEKIKNNINFRG